MSIASLIILVLVSGALGRRVARLLGFSFPTSLDDIVFSMAMGLGVIGLVTFLLGAVSLLYSAAAWAVVLLVAVVCFRDVAGISLAMVRWPLEEFRSSRGFLDRALLVLLLLLFLLIIVGSMAPPSNVDPLIYHLAAPKMYLAAHRLHYVPYNLFFSYPCHVQMIFLFSMMLNGGSLAQTVHCVFGILMVLQVYSLASGGSRRRSLVAACILLSVGGFLGESIFAMVDLALGCFSLLAFVSFYRWVQDGRRRWIVASAVFCGFAMGSKTHGLIVPFAVAALMMATSAARRMKPVRVLTLLALLFAVSAAAGAPSYIKNLVFTGNPFYPFLFGVFGGRDITPGLLEYLASIGTLGREGLFEKAGLFLVMPWKLTLGTWFYSVYDSFLIGPLYILFLPLLLHPAFRPRRLDRYILGFSVLYLAGWFILSPMVRTAYVVWALLAITVSGVWERLPRGFVRVAASLAILLWAAFQAGVYLYGGLPSFRAGLGLTPGREYLRKVLPLQSQGYFQWYDDYEWMNANLPPGSYVLCASNMNYYLDHPSLSLEYYLWHTYGADDAVFGKKFGGGAGDWPDLAVSPEKMLGRFSSMGVTHMFVLEGLGPRGSLDSLDAALAYLEDMGLLKKVYCRERASVYEISENGLFAPSGPEMDIPSWMK